MKDRPTDSNRQGIVGAADAPAREGWFGRRKRVVAREIASTGAEPKVVEVIAVHPKTGASPETVLDPTLLSERRRKRRQNFAYRITQLSMLLTLLAAAFAIVCVILEDWVTAQFLAVAACVLGVLLVRLVRLSRLAYRLRGYAAAACVLAVISLAISLLPHALHDDAKPAPVDTRPADVQHPS